MDEFLDKIADILFPQGEGKLIPIPIKEEEKYDE